MRLRNTRRTTGLEEVTRNEAAARLSSEGEPNALRGSNLEFRSDALEVHAGRVHESVLVQGSAHCLENLREVCTLPSRLVYEDDDVENGEIGGRACFLNLPGRRDDLVGMFVPKKRVKGVVRSEKGEVLAAAPCLRKVE